LRGNKQRGYVLEKEVQDVWTNLGANCKRVFGSGAFKKVGEEFEGDVRLEGLKIECKRRKSGNGFKSLYEWFEQDDADMLVVRADRKNRLYVLPEKLMIEMAQKMGWLEKKEKK
tara:strand:- start:446 stop:787 length:342 start_codon:yes stop_codon:yes gene_type:complete